MPGAATDELEIRDYAMPFVTEDGNRVEFSPPRRKSVRPARSLLAARFPLGGADRRGPMDHLLRDLDRAATLSRPVVFPGR